MTNLNDLRSTLTRLTHLPESIRNLQSLTNMDFRWNQLTHLPESIGNISNLTYLYLDNNQLATLPESTGQLKNLKFLTLDHNRLEKLPSELNKLRALEILKLQSNLLKQFPISILELKNLIWLLLKNNSKLGKFATKYNKERLRRLVIDRSSGKVKMNLEYSKTSISKFDPLRGDEPYEDGEGLLKDILPDSIRVILLEE